MNRQKTIKPTHRERVLRQARASRQKKWRVIPVPLGQKGPRRKGWPQLRLSDENLQDAFGSTDNIGVVLGEASGGLVDVDLDCKEAIAAARYFLPDTLRIHGRRSRPASHYWYKVTPPSNPVKFTDPDGTTLIEIRSTGQQTLIPPSIHPEGERFYWEQKGEPVHVKQQALSRAARQLAACSLLARHWPRKGSRHEASKALAGLLLRAGWSPDEVAEFVTATARASMRDEEWIGRKQDVRTTAWKLAKGQPATGTPRLIELIGEPVVTRVLDWLDLGPKVTILESLPRLANDFAAWPEPPSKKALQGLAGEIVSIIEPHSEADPAALLVQALTCYGNAIGKKPHFHVGSDCHFANLFAVLVGPTSKGRKGMSWSDINALFRKADPEWVDSCVQSGLSSGEGVIWSLRDPIERREPVKQKGRVVDYQQVIVDEGIEDKRLLALETEFSQPLKLMAREGNILSTVIRQAWDTGDLRTLTKTSPARATGAHLSIVAHISQQDLRRYLSETEQANGFGNRFLWCCVRRSKFLPDGGKLSEDELFAVIQRLKRSLDFARGTGEVKRSKKAAELWHAVYPELSEGRLGLLGAITSRAEAQVTRLSMIYALMDRSAIVRSRHIEAALALWTYCERSASFIFGDALGDPIADHLWRALRNSPEGITRTEISNLLQGHRSSKEIERALLLLAQSGLATCRQESTTGRPEERWLPVAGIAKEAKKAN